MPDRILRLFVQVVALGMAAYQIVYLFSPLLGASRHNIIHVGFALAVVLLNRIAKATGTYERMLNLLLLTASVVSIGYVLVEANRLEVQFGMGLTAFDFAIGCILLAVVVIVAYAFWGWVLPILGLLAITYFFFGNHIPGPLGFPDFGRDWVMDYLGMGISAGIFGYLMPISATVVFYFMLFGGVLGVTGMLPMFLEVGKAIGRVMRGGAAYTALVGSSLLGTVTGATVANVAFTGAYTIPTMKTQGFRPQEAAAIESVSSMGGQIMPPIMGAAAFLMALIIGVPYFTIVQKAVFPAILYYLAATVSIVVLIRAYGIAPALETVDKGIILKRLPVFLVPIIILVILLSRAYSPALAIVAALITCVFLSLLSKGTRPSVKSLLLGIIDGAVAGAELAAAIAVVAIVAQVAISTGLGPKLARVLLDASGGIVPLALIMVMVCCLILGCGMPTVAAYTIVAIVMIPSLKQLGIDIFAAHFFAFFFAILAAVTPPVATAALVGSRIAKVDFWSCSISAFRLSIPLFLIPFGIASEPQLLGFPNIGLPGLTMMAAVLLAGLALSIVTYRHFIVRLSTMDTSLSALSLALLVIYIVVMVQPALFLAALALLIAVVARQLRERRRHKPVEMPQ